MGHAFFTRVVALVRAIGNSAFKAAGFDNEPGERALGLSAASAGADLRHPNGAADLILPWPFA